MLLLHANVQKERTSLLCPDCAFVQRETSKASAMLPLLSSKPKEVDLRTFVVPAFYRRVKYDVSNAHTCAIIPTYGPGKITLQLVKDLLRYDPRIHIYVVNDCTPQDFKESALIFGTLAGMGARVTLLRTPENKLKAGALNYALRYIQKHARRLPDVIVTLDDDVVIDRRTIATLKDELLKHPELGAVCSQCRVLNKDTNILTRLQGLEYLGFNAIRMADEGFIFGPLVMHGMLTAFRSRAIWDIGGFDEGHLIEDYEVTTRLKCSGWSVKSAPQALAWTVVPESLSRFWRQRTRWSYGGIVVVANAPRLWPVFQDILGHAVFCLTITTILILQFVHGSGHVPSVITQMILGLSFAQLSVGYLFQLSR